MTVDEIVHNITNEYRKRTYVRQVYARPGIPDVDVDFTDAYIARCEHRWKLKRETEALHMRLKVKKLLEQTAVYLQ